MKMQAQQPGVGHKAEAVGKSPWQMLKITFNEWTLDKAPQLGASLAYYTLFSLAPLLWLDSSSLRWAPPECSCSSRTR